MTTNNNPDPGTWIATVNGNDVGRGTTMEEAIQDAVDHDADPNECVLHMVMPSGSLILPVTTNNNPDPLVERLRQSAQTLAEYDDAPLGSLLFYIGKMQREAADALEQKDAEIRELNDALDLAARNVLRLTRDNQQANKELQAHSRLLERERRAQDQLREMGLTPDETGPVLHTGKAAGS